MKTRTLLSLLIAALALVAGCAKRGAANVATAAAPPIAAAAVSVESRVLPRILEVTGALAADESADVASERDGQVAAVRVERGTYVARGAVLATLDEREAKAQLDQARANLAWAKAEVERYAELRRRQVVAKAEDQRKGTDLDLASAALALAEKAFEDCTIRAPFSGVVTEKKISAGAYVRRGQAICGLVKIDPLRAELAIPEAAVPFVKVGQKGRLNVQSFPGRPFDATVRYIGPSLRSEARTLVVEAVVPNPGLVLKPGLFVTARVELPTKEPTLLVPAAAVVTDSGVSHVYVLGTDRVSERIVALGDRYGDSVEVRSGVRTGERVVVNPDRRLADGLEVLRGGPAAGH
ncbi:MAG TPA: efflux RND transporter periplasmic adaptor subunit [Thermoanaerobaculia bacterium]|nr:efflux RND transporter periplasmic adaptor subunit [Thermoanaerobaculia bacterium]